MSLFSDDAVADLDAIEGWLENRRPGAGSSMVTSIIETASLLLQFPEAGRSGRVPGTREKPVARSPYLLVYVVTGEGDVRILRVLHGRRRWPPEA